MSWQSYVDDNLVGTGLILKAAMTGHDGSIWAITPGFNLTEAEVRALVAGYTSQADFQSKGIFIEGVKYQYLQIIDDRSIYGKFGSDNSLFVVKTGQCLLVAVSGKGMAPGSSANVVEKLADYLIESGY